MGRISRAMKIVPESLKNLEKVTHEVGDAAAKAENALQRTEKAAASTSNTAQGVSSAAAKSTVKPMGTPARFGNSTSTDYRRTFFNQHPETEGNVVVHHAVEQQTMKNYPGVVSPSQMHSLENLRGIPKGNINNRVHLSAIRREWNRFYDQHPNPTQQQLLDHATKLDDKYGHLFDPPIR